MPKMEPVAGLMDALNTYIYATIKAEMQLTGRSSTFSTNVGAVAAKMYFELLEITNVKIEGRDESFGAIKAYIDFVIGTGFLPKEAFVIKDDGDILNITMKKCIYAEPCKSLIDEGICKFNCMFKSHILEYGSRSGKRIRGTSKNDPGNCQMTFKLYDKPQK